MENKFSTYSVIPTQIMLDKSLSSTSKILYGIISSLTNEKGYCWASNEYLGELLGISKTRVSLIIKELIENNYIESNLYDNYKREIFILGALRKVKGGLKEKLKAPLRKVKDNNINEYYNNNIISKQGLREENIKENKQISEVMNEFKDINPLINFGNKTQRKAIVDLLKEFGFDNLMLMIRWYKKNSSDKYCPVATTPYLFKSKLGEIRVYANKLKNNNNGVVPKANF